MRTVLNALRTHGTGVLALWEWLKKNWAKLEKEISSNGLTGAQIIGDCTAGLSTASQLAEVEQFFKGKKTTVSRVLSDSLKISADSKTRGERK